MPSWAIRPADTNDAADIVAFARRMFAQNFAHYDPTALAEFLTSYYNVEIFHAQLSDPNYCFWLAEANGGIVAYATLGPYKLPPSPIAPSLIELHRLYVDKAWQKQHIGRALMDRALAEAKARGAQTICLGVWEHNTRAQAFYARYGFSKAGEFHFPPIGDVVDCEWLMARNVML